MKKRERERKRERDVTWLIKLANRDHKVTRSTPTFHSHIQNMYAVIEGCKN